LIHFYKREQVILEFSKPQRREAINS